MPQPLCYGDRILKKRYLKRKRCITGTLISLYTIAAIFVFAIIFIALNHFMKLWYPKQLGLGPWDHNRLPDNYDATHYDLSVYPDFYHEDSYGFEGNVTISLEVYHSTRHILVHKSNLSIADYNIAKGSLDITKTISRTFQKNDYWVLESESNFLPGNDYQLTIRFWSEWRNNSAFGFYRSDFIDESGQKRFLASTKFEPAGARLAFPCLDEPHRKSKFTIHLVHKSSSEALSNMPKKNYDYYFKSHDDGDLLMVSHFITNKVPMSTYLVAFVVAEYYADMKQTDDSNRPIRVFSPTHRINETVLAGQVALKMRDYLEKLYDMKDPMPKLDMIYIPLFSSGAMENWGLNTYRETRIMWNMGPRQKYFITKTTTHELCHIWFGNMVTMRWWNDIWLNEGFATYCQILANSVTHPELHSYIRQFRRYFLGDRSFLSRDRLNNVRQNPVRQSRYSADFSFNSYIYTKGAGILIWLETIIGKKELLNKTKSYLLEYQHRTATTEDLWRVFNQNSSLNYSNFTPWLEYKGYPLVSVNYHPDRNRFVISQEVCCDFDGSNIWPIILQYRTSTLRDFKIIHLNASEAEFAIEEFDYDNATDWILFNSEAFGLYRVEYGDDLWQRLCTALKQNHNQFTVFQRARLVDDAIRLNFALLKPLNYTMNIVAYMTKEDNYLPWSSVVDFVVELSKLPSGLNYMKRFENALSRIVSPRYEENSLYAIYNYVTLSCASNHSSCFQRLDNYTKMFGPYEAKVAGNLPSVMHYYRMVYNNSNEYFDHLNNLYNTTKNSVYSSALLMTNSEEKFLIILKRILEGKNMFCFRGCPYLLVRRIWNWMVRNCATPKAIRVSMICRQLVKPRYRLFLLVKNLDEPDDINKFRRLSKRMLIDDDMLTKIIPKIEYNIFRKRELIDWISDNVEE